MIESKKIVLLSLLFSLLLVPVTVSAHCQVPCGIYDDAARVEAMLEDVTTVEKSTEMIITLSGKEDPLSQNQLVRWVMNKEKHAQNIIETISDYFLTQRVKSSQKDYEARLVAHHKVIVDAMKVKQNVDMKYVEMLRMDVEALHVYYPEHTH